MRNHGFSKVNCRRCREAFESVEKVAKLEREVQTLRPPEQQTRPTKGSADLDETPTRFSTKKLI